jgi:hypothetical protein
MKEFRRRTWNFSVGVSLLLCVATCVLWVRQLVEPWREVTWGDEVTGTRVTIRPAYGYVLLYTATGVRPLPAEALAGTGEDAGRNWSLLGTQFYRCYDIGLGADMKPLPGTYGYHVGGAIHLAWPAVLSAILPLRFALRLLRHAARERRGNRGLCPCCGYDLRASPDRCPECGAVPAVKVTSGLPKPEGT